MRALTSARGGHLRPMTRDVLMKKAVLGRSSGPPQLFYGDLGPTLRREESSSTKIFLWLLAFSWVAFIDTSENTRIYRD